MSTEQLDLFGVVHSAAVSLRDFFCGRPENSEETRRENVSVHYAPRLRKGWRARFHRITGQVELTLPAYMEKEEFRAVRSMVLDWACHAARRKTARNRERLRDLEQQIWKMTEQLLADSGAKGLGAQRIPPIRPQGQVHDLEKVLAAVNSTYFKSELNCRITWSNRKGGQSYHTTRTDAFTGATVHIISISRGYDHANCPEYAVAGVVYHECLHIVIPPMQKNGRRVVHSRQFRQREKMYLFYDEWQKWHRMILPRNVRAL